MSARVPVLFAGLMIAGCSAEPSSRYYRESAGEAPAAMALVQGADAKPPADIPRRIIYTAAIELAVEDLDPVIANAREQVAGFKGYVAKAEVTGRANGHRTATLTARVPVGQFPAAVAAFGGLGVVTKSATDSQDVTEEFIDVEARLKNYKAEEAALNKLLESAAGKLEDVLKIREQVVRNRAEIERVEGRLKYLSSQTELSTITLTVREEREYTPAAARSFGTRLGDQLGWSVGQVRLFGENLALGAVALVPWLPLIAVGLFALRAVMRRQRRRALTSASPPTGDGPSGRTAAASP